jgi:CrcB protein
LRWIAIAAGGALGALARWSVGIMLSALTFPAGTLAVNLIGAYALGWLYGRTPEKNKYGVWYQGAAAGFLGAFTTLSAFGLDAWLLFDEGRFVTGAVYVAVTAFIGPWLARIGWNRGATASDWTAGERAS